MERGAGMKYTYESLQEIAHITRGSAAGKAARQPLAGERLCRGSREQRAGELRAASLAPPWGFGLLR